MNIWFTSDEHHGHRNIMQFCKRPFSTLSEMTDGLVARHNEVVEPGDLVYHVGDMFWRTLPQTEALSIMSRLKGTHFYVRGNHEEMFDGLSALHSRFGWVRERAHIWPDGGPKSGIILDHFAGRVWGQSDKGSWQLYGHSHAELPEDASMLSFDVGVDANNYYPVSLTTVRERMETKLKWMQRKIDGAKKKVA